jgi:hypothetical protein
MAKTVDPDDLNQGTEVIFVPSARTIQVVPFEQNASSNISGSGSSATNGVTFQCLYSFAKEEWRTDNELIKYPFPLVSITEESFELVNDWDLITGTTRELIRDGGWSLKDSGGTSVEEYMNVTTLGTFDSSITDLAYYLQLSGTSGSPTNMVFSGEVNQAVKIYGGTDYGNVNYRDIFKIYLREQGKTYGFYDLLTEQNLTSLTFKKFAMPLANGTDLNISVADSGIDSNSDGTADQDPYSAMSITYYDTPQVRSIGGTNYNFSIIIEGASATKEQIYEFVQWSLRQDVDIDAGSGNTRGSIAEELLEFVGDTLKTKLTDRGGVFIDNFNAVDTNNLVFVDDTGTERTFPFVAAGTIQFNDNLQNDNDAIYRVFFTNDDAGDNNGQDFGTASAITINDNSNSAITDSVSGRTSVAFDYDYDNNTQRGPSSSGTTVPYTAVAIGLGTAQYVVTTGSIVRSTSNVINFVAALERNYLNPA